MNQNHNALVSNHSVICNILDDSEETLWSFSIGLLEKGIIDKKVKNSATRKEGLAGADVLVTHIELMVEQNPEHLRTVLNVMEKEHCLENVAKDIRITSALEGESHEVITTAG